MNVAILPAAGLSRRMGEPKLLLPWRGRPLIEHVLSVWTAAVEHVAVVVRRDDHALADHCRAPGVLLVQPAVDPPDMKASVQAALLAVEKELQPSPTDGWLLAPADLPRLSPSIIERMLAARRRDPHSVHIASFDGQRGHPLAAPWRLAADVHRLGTNQGVRDLLSSWPVVAQPCDSDAVLTDVDTPTQYRKLFDADREVATDVGDSQNVEDIERQAQGPSSDEDRT